MRGVVRRHMDPGLIVWQNTSKQSVAASRVVGETVGGHATTPQGRGGSISEQNLGEACLMQNDFLWKLAQ